MHKDSSDRSQMDPPFPNGECAISIFELCGVFINAMHAAKLIQVRAISERAHVMFVGLCHFFVSWKCFGVNDSTAAKAKNKLWCQTARCLTLDSSGFTFALPRAVNFDLEVLWRWWNELSRCNVCILETYL